MKDTIYNNAVVDLMPIAIPELKPLMRNQLVCNEKIGRNSLCPCGSGKKYKHCCITEQKYRKIIRLKKIKRR